MVHTGDRAGFHWHIIGSPPNAIAIGVVNEAGLDINFMEWMLVGVPLAIFFTIVLWLVLIWRFKSNITTIAITFDKQPHPL